MLEYSILDSVNGRKYKPYLFIKNEAYGALGDDFSNLDSHTLKILVSDALKVLNGESTQKDIGGYVCYWISMTKNLSEIYCYNEKLGEEATIDIFNMLTALANQIELYESGNEKT